VGLFVRVPGRIGPATGQLTGVQAWLNRVRAVAFVSQDSRCTDSRGVAQHSRRLIGAENRVVEHGGVLTDPSGDPVRTGPP
jgi:hypothetical protein